MPIVQYDKAGLGAPYAQRGYHRHWLMDQARGLLEFFNDASFNPKGGFYFLKGDGSPILEEPRGKGPMRELFAICRLIHCNAAAMVLGHPGAEEMVDHGINYLLDQHRDTTHGGYPVGVDDEGIVRGQKEAYGHAFVLLAAASAHEVGHPRAREMHEDISKVIFEHFWDDENGVMREEFNQDWSPISSYRGQNSNMHSTEALMAAYEAWDDPKFLEMAERIAEMIINRHAREAGWVVIEHFDDQWNADKAYAGDPMFRPAGTTPGHALEWSRLLIQLWNLGGKKHAWMPEAADALFKNAVEMAWSEPRGGFVYTLGWDNKTDMPNRFWWPSCEAMAAAAVLRVNLEDAYYEEWYRRIVSVLRRDYIDHEQGGWWPESDANGKPTESVFEGKPDIYHAFQACLIPLLPADRGILKGLKAKLTELP